MMSKKTESKLPSSSSRCEITVIVPVYNLENVIRESLDSILNQTIKNYRLVLVNDGSTDNSLHILNEYSKKHSSITVINKSNGGVSSARNAGISAINTRYFTFVDGDDILHSELLERLLYAIQDSDADMATSLLVRNVDSMKISNTTELVATGIVPTKQLLYDRSIKNSPCAKIYRTSKLKQVMYNPNITIGEDMEYIFQCLKICENVVITNHMLYTYIGREGSATNKDFDKKRNDSYKVATKIRDSVLSTELESAATAKLFVEALSVAAHVHKKRASHSEIYDACLVSMMQSARSVLCDSDARIRQRIYSAFAVLNPSISILLVNLKKSIVSRK